MKNIISLALLAGFAATAAAGDIVIRNDNDYPLAGKVDWQCSYPGDDADPETRLQHADFATDPGGRFSVEACRSRPQAAPLTIIIRVSYENGWGNPAEHGREIIFDPGEAFESTEFVLPRLDKQVDEE
ncbi:MAG: hypothetical protein R3217_08870 [Gammaproteobacteria bacterium]|nr:hypothetical protein [Gammaproteobacteria bacterium]